MTGRILVTGASGFVAEAIFSGGHAGERPVGASRRPVGYAGVEWRRSPDLSGTADWAAVLKDCGVVIHLAGRVHMASGGDPSAFWTENFDGTIKLACDAKAAGVRRFVFLSSSKVLGDESGTFPLAEDAAASPVGPYAESKLAAERGLAGVGGAMEVVVIRPPLVYGPGVKANFSALLSSVARGVPLPLAGIRNRRSLVGVANLASAIAVCAHIPSAAGRTYHVTDGEPVSTPGLVRALSAALGRPPRLFNVPARLLELGGSLVGCGAMVRRLTRSMELDDSAIRSELGWRPETSFEAGIARTVEWYRGREGLRR